MIFSDDTYELKLFLATQNGNKQVYPERVALFFAKILPANKIMEIP